MKSFFSIKEPAVLKEPVKLNFAEEFSSYPYGKSEEDGKYNGAAFREILAKKFEQAQENDAKLEVVLDNVYGLGGSFLNAAFGEFAKELKKKGQSLSDKNFSVQSSVSHHKIYINRIWEHINKHYDASDSKS